MFTELTSSDFVYLTYFLNLNFPCIEKVGVSVQGALSFIITIFAKRVAKPCSATNYMIFENGETLQTQSGRKGKLTMKKETKKRSLPAR